MGEDCVGRFLKHNRDKKKRIRRIKNKFIEDSFCSKFIIYKKRYTAFFFNFKWLSEAESGLNFLIFSDHQKASLGA